MDLQYALSALDVRVWDYDLAVEPARSHKSGIEHIGPVGCRDEDNTFVGFEAVHLHKKGVERLFPLVVPPSQTCSAVSAHSVDLVNENDTWRVLLALVEQVPYPGGSYTHKHLHKIGTADGKERHAGLTRDSFGQKGFTCAWRTHEQDSLWYLATEPLKPLGVL